MKKLITNEVFGICALLTLLIPQVAHTVYVFKINSHYGDPWFTWSYAIGVDLAILIFTVRGWIKTAVIYFFGTLAHNIVYQFWPESVWSAALLCLMLSATIFSFSHLFYYENPMKIRSEKLSDDLKLLIAASQSGVRCELQPFECPECGEAFTSSKKLNGHISGHKARDNWYPSTYGDWEKENQRRSSAIYIQQNPKNHG